MAEDETRLSNKLVAFRQISGHIQVLHFNNYIRTKIAVVLATPHLEFVHSTKQKKYFDLHGDVLHYNPIRLNLGDIWRPFQGSYRFQWFEFCWSVKKPAAEAAGTDPSR